MSIGEASSSLTALPTELVQHIFFYLAPFELHDVSLTCKTLYNQAQTDSLWERLVQENLHSKLPTAKPCASYKDLYTSHHAQWFLPRHRIWFADTPLYGKLVLARYDPRLGAIEAYSVAAERGRTRSGRLDWETEVVYHTFNPKIRLDLNLPVLSLSLEDAHIDTRHGKRYESEILMENSRAPSSKPSSTFMFARAMPHHLLAPNSSVWPPLSLPSPKCTRSLNESHSAFRSLGHRPSTYSERSDATFRVRRFLDYGHHFIPMHIINTLGGVSGFGRTAEVVTTFGTLPVECYTPTKERPWQGIWCGDYSGHGCEFLLITQSDGQKALPDKARKAIATWPRTNIEPWGHDGGDSDEDASDNEDEPATGSLQFETLIHEDPHHSESSSPGGASSTPKHVDEAPYCGRLEAIKLTGDPNIPRGEITFVADDIGVGGFLGHATEPEFSSSITTPDDEVFNFSNPSWDPSFTSAISQTSEATASLLSADPKGARKFKSVGHVAGRNFTDDGYIPTQLILISADRIAQYWQPFGHISFYQRVDLDQLTTS